MFAGIRLHDATLGPPAPALDVSPGSSPPSAVRAASPAQLAGLGEHRADIVRLVEVEHPDVMALLFHPDERLWSVDALDLLHHTRRLLTFQFDSDDPEQERRMWAALRIVLGRS